MIDIYVSLNYILDTYPNGTSVSLVFVSIVLMLFVVLSGYHDIIPLNQTWFLEVDTSGIHGADRSLSRWTYFYICGIENENCGSPVPGLPIGYAWSRGNDGVPSDLTGYVIAHLHLWS